MMQGRNRDGFTQVSDLATDALAYFDMVVAQLKADGRVIDVPPDDPEQMAINLFRKRGYDLGGNGAYDSLVLWPSIMAKMRADRMERMQCWMLSGGFGTGKTTCARLASEFAGVEMVSSFDLMFQLRDGMSSLSAWKEATRIGTVTISGRAKGCDLIIDELGRENPNVSDYGMVRNLMAECLEQRLDLWPHIRTYIVTNKTPEELDAMYGERFSSRRTQVFFPFMLVGPDRRGGDIQPLEPPKENHFF
jgi:hypothetical protein